MENKSKNQIYKVILMLIGVLFLILPEGCKTNNPETVTDIDGNVYQTIKIGTQTWMVENLKTTRYRNGDLIANITDTMQWSHLPFGIYCNYNNDPKNGNIYGRLYNWYAINDPRNIAPEGWHIPTYEEILTLVANIGGDTIAAGKLKESGTEHWLIPNTGASNESGFTALPGGYRFNSVGTFHTLGSNGYWWTTNQSFEMYAWSKRIFWYLGHPDYNHDHKTFGFSVRCIKD